MVTATDARPARQRILDSAIRLFYANGPRGVGVDTVIADSSVAKATFYKHYPSKDDLILAYLDTVHGPWFDAVRACARAGGDDPRGQLVAMFDAVDDEYRRDDYRGCAQLNAAAEAVPGSPVQRRTAENKAIVRDWITDTCRRAEAAQPDVLAAQLVLLIDGALAGALSDTDERAPGAAKAAAAILVQAHCPE